MMRYMWRGWLAKRWRKSKQLLIMYDQHLHQTGDCSRAGRMGRVLCSIQGLMLMP